MLRLITGEAKSGKTRRLLADIAERAAAGGRCLLVVPEQISFEYERMLCRALTPLAASFVSVKSFSSLARDIFKRYGGAAVARADDAVRLALARRAADSVSTAISYYKKHLRSTAFYERMLDAIDELSQSGVPSTLILDISSDKQLPAARRARLREFALIYAAYEGLLNDKYSDRNSELTDAAERTEVEFFADAAVFFDEFDGFSAAETAMIMRIIDGAPSVCFAVCCDEALSGAAPALASGALCARRLLSAYRERTGKSGEVVYVNDPQAMPAGIRNLRAYMSGKAYTGEREGVRFTVGDSRYDETARVAAEISLLVRERGYSYSDIAVVCGALSSYRFAVERVFSQYGIPFFCDFGSDLLSSPLCVMLSMILDCAIRGLSTESLLRLMKCGLVDAEEDAVFELEDYVFVWNIDYSRWREPFTNNPDGYAEGMSADASERLSRIEALRLRVVSAVLDFCEKARHMRGEQLVRELYSCCVAIGAEKCINATADQRTQESDELVRQYNLCCEGLDKLMLIFTDEPADAADIRDTMTALFASTKLFDVPNMLDGVLVGEAARTRALSTKAVFVMGLCEGQFPRDVSSGSFWSEADYALMEQRGAMVQTSFARRFELERAKLYRALSSGSERVYLSLPARETGGAALSLCGEMKSFVSGCEPFMSESLPFPLVAGGDSAAAVYVERRDPTLAAALEAAGCGAARLFADSLYEKSGFASADERLRKKIFGDALVLSPTVVESAFGCRFAYFMNHIMKIEPLRRSELSPISSGSYLHYVLEQAVGELGEQIGDAPDERLRELCDRHTALYLDAVMGGESANSPRTLYILKRLKAQLFTLLKTMSGEARRSSFVTDRTELVIGEGGVPARTLVTPDGHTVSMTGKIDRVDVFSANGSEYVRVVDYKSGGKEFKLSNVYCGLSLQMLIYLFTVCENGGYSDAVPAAALYMPIDPSLERGREAAAYCMDGIILRDDSVIEAMDNDRTKLVIPVKSALDRSSKLASLEKLGRIKTHIDGLLCSLADTIYKGDFGAEPLGEKRGMPCEYCSYSVACARYKTNERGAADIAPENAFEEVENG